MLRRSIGMFIVGLIASLMLGLCPAASAVSTLDQVQGRAAVNCSTQIGISPYCSPSKYFPLAAKWMSGGKYCFAIYNVDPSGRTVQIAAKIIGGNSGPFRKVRHNAYHEFCPTLPAGKCPRVNFRYRSEPSFENNIGTFQTCDSGWHVPTTKQSWFRMCHRNDSTSRRWMELTTGTRHTLQSLVFMDPGERRCVRLNFDSRHPSRHIRVRYYRVDRPIRAQSILTDAFYQRVIAG